MDLQSEYCSHMGNILKLGGYQLQVVYLESYLFPSLLLLVGDLRRSGRLKKRVRFTFPTLFAKKTYYLPIHILHYRISKSCKGYRYSQHIGMSDCEPTIQKSYPDFQKLPAYSELNIYNPAVHFQSVLRKVKYIYILPNHPLVEPRYYHSVRSKITLLPRPWQYHADGSKKFFFHFWMNLAILSFLSYT